MTNFNSVSDLARSYQLRLSQGSLKSKLDTLTQETMTGLKADIPLAVGGDLTRINHVQARLSQLATYNNNIFESQGLFSGMQTAISSIQSFASSTGTVLLSEALISSDSALRIQIDKGSDGFRSTLAALNTSVAGKYAFSGSGTDQPAVASYNAIMAQITTAVAGATTAADIQASIDAYFDAPVGSGGFADTGYLGDDSGSTSMSASSDKTLGVNLTAASAEFRDTIKGFALLSFSAENPTLGMQTHRALARAAGNSILAGDARLIAAASKIGVQEEAAAKLKTANDAETSALKIARISLIGADPYETSVALKEIEANIETVYTLTTRLSKLSLTGYL